MKIHTYIRTLENILISNVLFSCLRYSYFHKFTPPSPAGVNAGNLRPLVNLRYPWIGQPY
jgi:hypothetical protein